MTSDILIKRKSWFIRFFMWVWETEEEKLDQCRVFWGLLFFPLGVVANESMNWCYKWFLFCSSCLLYSAITQLFFSCQIFKTTLVVLIIISVFGFGGLFATGCILGFEFVIKKLKNKSNKSEKVLNKITVIGSTLTNKIKHFLGIIFSPIGKIILFILKPITKWIPWKKLWNKITENGKAENFLFFMVRNILSFKEKHCRKIKLVD